MQCMSQETTEYHISSFIVWKVLYLLCIYKSFKVPMPTKGHGRTTYILWVSQVSAGGGETPDFEGHFPTASQLVSGRKPTTKQGHCAQRPQCYITQK